MARSIISLSLALALATPFHASAAQADTVPPIPAPGRMLDLGGWRVHLNCTGTRAAGQPLIVLEAGG